MLRITLLTVGKLKESFYRQAAEEFQKRLSRYCRLEILEVADEKTPDGAAEAEEESIRRKEGERLLKLIRDGAYVITLEIGGRMMDSEGFAGRLKELAVQGRSHIVFVIGGSLGLSAEVRRRSDFALSFSPMTFPHQLMRIILLEQVYRGFRILSGEPYHK
jgi:23S rRNA (pseudouridine1915-N3)-methyltransferase